MSDARRPRHRPQAVALWPARRRDRRVLLAASLTAPLVAVVAVAALIFLVGPPVPNESYVEAVADEPPLLNPVLAPFTLAGQDVLSLVFVGLIRSDPLGNPTPDLAESWEISPDGRTVTVRLRDGLTWHDGAPLQADDVAFTVRTVQSAEHQGSQELAELWRGIVVTVVDPLTVSFALPEPLASFLEHLTLGLLPRHVLEGVPPAELPHHPFNRQPIGSGPYRVAAMSPQQLTLERFDRFHMAAPRLARITLRYFASRDQAVDGLLAGDVDGMGHLRPEDLQRFATSSDLILYSVPERSKTALLALNVRTPLFQERAVRLALASAIDRDAVARRSVGGQAEPAVGPIPAQSWAFAGLAGAEAPDLPRAASLLDAAGWLQGADKVREREGQRLEFSLLAPDTPERLAVADELAEQLGRVGIRALVRTLPADELTEDYLETRQFEAALVGQWAMGSDPDVYPQWHSSQSALQGGNIAGLSDPDLDRWLEVGRQQLGREERRNAYLHFQAAWAQEQPSVTLYHPIYSFALHKEIQGVRPDPVPDSSWRLRDAVNWYRVHRPTPLQQLRAVVGQWLGL